jgi:hypothetical protein
MEVVSGIPEYREHVEVFWILTWVPKRAIPEVA